MLISSFDHVENSDNVDTTLQRIQGNSGFAHPPGGDHTIRGAIKSVPSPNPL
jgi:hypothetical protein